MKGLFNEAKIVPTIVGNLKRIPIMRKLLPVSTGGTNDARYCYSVWHRHLHYYTKYSGNGVPCVVAELGPGDSLGIGLSAILSGSMKYYAFDIQHYWNAQKNVKIFDELVQLFKSRSGIPDESEFKNVSPELPSYSFPKKILTDEILQNSLSDERLQAIRQELMNPENQNNKIIKYQIPWHDSTVVEKGTVDFILSQAVLEHIDDLESTYSTMALWLSDNGKISHTIDFKCHGMTKSWNGHWCLSDFEWNIVRGGRIYAINRQPVSVHNMYLEKYKFNVYEKIIKKADSRVSRSNLAPKFRNISQEDFFTTGVYIIAGK